jgi:hypothetical protein
MPQLEILSPGVYGFERSPAVAPEGVSPAKAAFVGWTDEGPSNTPIEVRSVEEFRAVFGDISTLGLVPIEVRAFFETGGERCFIVRCVSADAIAATIDVDPMPGPTKWTFTSKGEGVWGNDTLIRIRGNRNFLDRTPGSPAWEKFDFIVFRPSDFDPNILEAKETYEAVQFADPDGGDYLTNVVNDPRRPSALIEVIEGAGGTPAGLLGSTVADENVGTGAPPQTQFTFSLAQTRVLDGSVQIIAGGTQNNDENQTVVPLPDNIATDFALTLPNVPALDGSLSLFAAGQPVSNELVPVVPPPDGITTVFTLPALTLANKVHRETAIFNLKFAANGTTSGPNPLWTDGGGGLSHDLALTPITLALPVHPGQAVLSIDIGSGPTPQLDDGLGNFPPTPELPAGGTINYASGLLTGVTAPLLAGSTITETHTPSTSITKAVTTDNLDTAVPFVAPAIGTVGLVNNAANPTGAGAMLVDVTAIAPAVSGSFFYLDYVPLQIVSYDVAGAGTGDIGAGSNATDFETGVTSVSFAQAALTGETIDADYATGLIATDDGIGNIVGNVDAAGNNTINYDTGAVDLTWDTAPLGGAAILANYDVLADELDFQLAGGVNGSAVSRAAVSAAALETDKKGIYALDLVEEPTNVVVPDFEGSEYVQFDMVQFARARSDMRYLIMGFANGTTVPEAVKYVQVTQAWNEKIGAMYYPNIYFLNEVTERPQLIPVTGFVAGVYAKTANNKNVGKAPGGIEDGALDGGNTLSAEFILELTDRDSLYQSRINPIISSRATGLAVWGVRSLSKESRWRYVNARTLHNYLMYTTSLQLQWAVFENNGPALWAKIETALKGYYGSLFRLGYFAGEVESDAFFVKCNSTNNNATTVAEGKAYIEIGFSPSTPAEFVIFYLQQPVGQTATLA